jgi:hypothetical protein
MWQRVLFLKNRIWYRTRTPVFRHLPQRILDLRKILLDLIMQQYLVSHVVRKISQRCRNIPQFRTVLHMVTALYGHGITNRWNARSHNRSVMRAGKKAPGSWRN